MKQPSNPETHEIYTPQKFVQYKVPTRFHSRDNIIIQYNYSFCRAQKLN